MTADEMPQKLGRYKIVRELGRGAMGVVYEGLDPNIERRVAIKTARRDVISASAHASEMMERFLREARAAGALNHPNIITIYDADEENGIAYIAMEFLEGGDLRDLLERHKQLKPEDIVKAGAAVCEALACAHDHGIVHRDIKPANVMMPRDTPPKLADFGIAHMADSTLTQEGALIGTPFYMSPEQFMGKKVDGRSDLFSVAVMLYELATGEKPFTGEALSTVMHHVIRTDPVPPHELNFNISEPLSRVILTAMSKRPADRYANGRAMAAALRESLKANPDRNVLQTGQPADATPRNRGSEIPTVIGGPPPSVTGKTSPRSAASCSPFVLVDSDFHLFGPPLPFPLRQHYIDGLVPAFAAEAEVQERLRQYQWVFLLGEPSVGKTTLALRIATARDQIGNPVYYLDLAKLADYDPDAKVLPALRRLVAAGTLIIVDNVNHDPELARRLWDEWRIDAQGSRLLLIATRTQHAGITAPSQDLTFFEHHVTNPAVSLVPIPQDMAQIVKFLHTVTNPAAPPLDGPPEDELTRWYSDFGKTLGAFCCAAMGHLPNLQKKRWELPIKAASDWVRKKWLKNLNFENHENLRCLAVFGAQDLELEVQDEALPFPGCTDQLSGLGLIANARYGQHRQYRRFSLREPDWGRLVLTAQREPVDVDHVLFTAAGRRLVMAVALISRLQRTGQQERMVRLWTYLAEHADAIAKKIHELPLPYFQNLVRAAVAAGSRALANQFWNELENNRDALIARAWETQLHFLGAFLNTAREHGRDTVWLWEALEKEPERLLVPAWNAPLDHVASFLDTARAHKRDTDKLWNCLENDRDKLLARAWASQLNWLGPFFNTAKTHGRDTVWLWEALEKEPEKLAARVWETPLGYVASFLNTAKAHGRDTSTLWEALEKESDRLAACAWESPLGYVGSFLNTAKAHGRDTSKLWDALEKEPERLAARAWETSLGYVGPFLNTAKEHGRDMVWLWEALEKEPEKLAAHAWDSPLEHVGSFFGTAREQGRNMSKLWEALEKDPQKLAARAWETPLDHLGSFFDTAKEQGRDTSKLWDTLEKDPQELAARAWETPLDHLGSFFDTAMEHGRDTSKLWDAIEKDPQKLAARAWETPLGHLGSFFDTAKEQGRDTSKLWDTLEKDPHKLAARAWETSLDHLGSFFDTAKRHERDTEFIGQILSSNPNRLSTSATMASIVELAGFLHHAPEVAVKAAIADLRPTHWDNVTTTESMIGATLVAGRCGEVGREDLKSALLTKLLRRASPQDFPPQVPGFANVAWLLNNAPADAKRLIPGFLDALRGKKWLGWQFNKAESGVLATGLRLLGLHQPSDIIRRFHHPGLGYRLNREFSEFDRVSAEQQCLSVQLLGCATLCGYTVNRNWLDRVIYRQIETLPVSTLPHKPDATRLDNYRLQLWLGLRAYASITRDILLVPPELIRQTLSLWRANLEESAMSHDTGSHRLNEGMVSWLERCHDQGVLIPDSEPLWVYAGFPARRYVRRGTTY